MIHPDWRTLRTCAALRMLTTTCLLNSYHTDSAVIGTFTLLSKYDITNREWLITTKVYFSITQADIFQWKSKLSIIHNCHKVCHFNHMSHQKESLSPLSLMSLSCDPIKSRAKSQLNIHDKRNTVMMCCVNQSSSLLKLAFFGEYT